MHKLIALLVLLFGMTLSSQAVAQRIKVSGDRMPAVPEEYLVDDGDTIWGVCDYYFGEPRMWPTVWALNPHITNPHWIYPGDIIRLRMPGAPVQTGGVALKSFDYTVGSQAAEQVSLNEGFVIEKTMVSRGFISYSPSTHRYLALDDLVYIKMTDKKAVRTGNRFTIYRPMNDVTHPVSEKIVGQKVEVLGVAEVIRIDPDTEVPIARITSAFREIERGMPVMEVQEHTVVVAPRMNELPVEGVVVDSMSKRQEISQYDTVFIDRGAKDGVQIGNRFMIMRRGDGRMDLKLEQNRELPWTQVGEAMVVSSRDRTSTALITKSAVEIRRGDRAIMQLHY